jgi:uncharacterized protein YeaO (DUF488 family)
MIQLKRAYDKASDGDGERFLVDRLWPRGVNKSALAVAAWLKDASPSTELRKWYSHDPAKWSEFRKRYFAELQARPEAWQPLVEAAHKGTITLVYSSRERERSNAVALKEFVEQKVIGPPSQARRKNKDAPSLGHPLPHPKRKKRV